MKLSIVIPVYNVEKYIEKCLLSCINQKGVSTDDYEIIIVNDGTKDNSMEIVDKVLSYQTSKPYINIVNQENKGLSEARNTGLQYVRGEYVWFVDSDDWIDEDSVDSILKSLQTDAVDVLQIPYKLVYEDDTKVEIEPVKNISTPISGKECMKITRLPNLAQSRILKKSFLLEKKLRFTPSILHEDAEFKPRLLYQASSVRVLNKPLYNYLKRTSGSITASFTMRNALGRWYGVKSMDEFSKDFSFHDKLLFNNDMNFNMFFVVKGLKKLSKSDRDFLIDNIVANHKIFKRMIRSNSPKKILLYSMLYLSPRLFLKILG